MVLFRGKLDFCVNNNGCLSEMCANSLYVSVKNDDLYIVTDRGCYELSKLPCSYIDGNFRYRAGDAYFTLSYETVPNAFFLKRTLSMTFNCSTTLLSIGMRFDVEGQRLLYKTFYNASAAVFLRDGENGICYGFANPYFYLTEDGIAFEPSFYLGAREKFECDLNFIGLYQLWGEFVRPTLAQTTMRRNGRHHPRYRCPGEGTPLLEAEIIAFNRFTADYFECDKKEFRFTSYNYFSNLPQRPETEEEKELYLRHIDNFVKMGGDTIILNPLYPNSIPTPDENSIWELFPANTMAEEIYRYALRKGLKVGIYMGTAGNGIHGNSATISYGEISQWKKVDVCGTESEENCLGDDDFVRWFIQVQKNTIKKYQLSLWDWDPGPGNAMFCYNLKHRHLPGKGAYLGFRNSLFVMKELKEEFPHLYYMAFHGNKEYGLWGLRYIDQHEAFWENDLYYLHPMFSDLSVDRATADGIRLQSSWDYYFRFLPASMNHGLAHRMVQDCNMRKIQLDCLVDKIGWKFALLSAIAVGGPVTLPIIPREPEEIEEYVPFYKKWIGWARENFHYSHYTIPFGKQTGCGTEGYAKIINNEGYIFVFNSYPTPNQITIPFTCRIGIVENGETLFLKRIYPIEENLGSLSCKAHVTLNLAPYSVQVIRVSKNMQESVSEDLVAPLPRYLISTREGKDTCFKFQASDRMKRLVEEQSRTINPEILAIKDDYDSAFARTNDCWMRPDRLWLWVFFVDSSEVEGLEIAVESTVVDYKMDCISCFDYKEEGVVFADITDAVIWGKENRIDVRLKRGKIVGAYLHYMGSEEERFPEAAIPFEILYREAPLVDASVKILDARLNDDNIILPEQENELVVETNLPAENMEGVYASVPISIGDSGVELRSDMALVYENGTWRKRFKSGSRIHLIVDDNKICIWAVTKENTESETYELQIDWKMAGK